MLVCFLLHVFSLETYGAKVTQLGAEVGSRPSQEAIKEACSKTQFKFVTVTHVDTS
jgi:alanine-glyoxylate transaminase/serine-glyoxylate transaminase/serine-pyruvate transaminase